MAHLWNMAKLLTAQQRTFADAVISGSTGADAARAAGVKVLAGPRAVKWMRHPKVAAYIAAGRAALAEEELLSRKEAVAALAKIAKRRGRDRAATARDVVAAVAQAAKMLGYDAPTKVEVKVEGSLLHRIRSGSR